MAQQIKSLAISGSTGTVFFAAYIVQASQYFSKDLDSHHAMWMHIREKKERKQRVRSLTKLVALPFNYLPCNCNYSVFELSLVERIFSWCLSLQFGLWVCSLFAHSAEMSAYIYRVRGTLPQGLLLTCKLLKSSPNFHTVCFCSASLPPLGQVRSGSFASSLAESCPVVLVMQHEKSLPCLT